MCEGQHYIVTVPIGHHQRTKTGEKDTHYPETWNWSVTMTLLTLFNNTCYKPFLKHPCMNHGFKLYSASSNVYHTSGLQHIWNVWHMEHGKRPVPPPVSIVMWTFSAEKGQIETFALASLLHFSLHREPYSGAALMEDELSLGTLLANFPHYPKSSAAFREMMSISITSCETILKRQ